MPEGYGGREVYGMLVAYGSLIKTVERLGDGLSVAGANQFTRDKLARDILYTLIPEYKKWVPEEIRRHLALDINSLEERCKKAIIQKASEASLKP